MPECLFSASVLKSLEELSRRSHLSFARGEPSLCVLVQPAEVRLVVAQVKGQRGSATAGSLD